MSHVRRMQSVRNHEHIEGLCVVFELRYIITLILLSRCMGSELSVSELGLGQWLLAQVSECRGERRGLVP